MPKTKYRFNAELLTFERYRRSVTAIVIRIAGIVSTVFVGAFLLYWLASSFFASPRERMLELELQKSNEQYALLNNRLKLIEEVVNDLEFRDENIYRTIFEAEPIPSSIRDAGYGGVDRYNKLEGYSNSKMVISTTKQIDKIAKKLYILSKSFDEISKLASNKEDMLASIPAIQPVKLSKRVVISSGFGYRVHPIYKVVKFHQGLDFLAPTGTPIFATGNGRVESTSRNRSGYGNEIVISHGFGYKTLYAHCNTILVRPGQKVVRGEQIGTVGSTGLSTAPHLHYEVWLGKNKLNPVFFLHNDLKPDEFEEVLLKAEEANQTLD